MSDSLPEFFHFLEEIVILRGFILGFIHIIMALIGFYSGCSKKGLVKLVSNGYVKGIFGVILHMSLLIL